MPRSISDRFAAACRIKNAAAVLRKGNNSVASSAAPAKKRSGFSTRCDNEDTSNNNLISRAKAVSSAGGSVFISFPIQWSSWPVDTGRRRDFFVVVDPTRSSAANNDFTGGNGVTSPGDLKKIFLDKLASVATKTQSYDELAATKLDRQCGLPFPIIFGRENQNLAPENITRESVQQGRFWEEKCLQLSKLPALYAQLSKARLSTLVVVTALGGYAACPLSFQLLPFAGCILGTYLTAFSANAINQCLEAPFDAQMKRTQNRVLPKQSLSAFHTAMFGLATGSIGVCVLYNLTNPTTALLGLSNIILYTSIYTPMKRFSIYNTWVGSLVGAIPPVMGWTACGGTIDSRSLILAAVLFAWQFPHFNALSWNLRADYSKAGYCMMSSTRPDLLRRTALTYSLSLIPLSSLMAPATGLTNWTFALTSLPLNLYMTVLAFKFFKETDSKNSKKLFRCSLIYLPVLMTLILLSKPKTTKVNENDSGGSFQQSIKDENQSSGNSSLTSRLGNLDFMRHFLKLFSS